ncbi:MAG: amidohydrolase [Mucilaginibacter sp.]
MKKVCPAFIICLSLSLNLFAQSDALKAVVAKKADALQSKLIAWRRDFHQHPELSNREVRTAAIIAKHLESLGIQVTTGVATTGVVGILKGDKPGPVVALRADMDGLPVTETTGLPFASNVKTTYNGKEVGVMHACGHDAHMAILMAVAEVLSSMKKDLHGTVKFIFQPAEEGPPMGEEGGAPEMIKQGVLTNPKVDAIFGLHIWSNLEVGKLSYRSGGIMAGAVDLKIVVTGTPSHGGYPWQGVDPIVVSAQIINNLQSIVSRNVNVTQNPAVVTIGTINGGTRRNIIAEQTEMMGTARYFSAEDEKTVLDNIKRIAVNTAEAYGATAELTAPYTSQAPVTFNDPALMAKMLPTLQATAGNGNLLQQTPVTGAEDFSFYQKEVPGLFFFLGGMPKGADPLKAPPHHTPGFYIDEGGFTLGVKTLCNLALDYMDKQGK